MCEGEVVQKRKHEAEKKNLSILKLYSAAYVLGVKLGQYNFRRLYTLCSLRTYSTFTPGKCGRL